MAKSFVLDYIMTPRYGYMLEVKLPSMKIVCPHCCGEGTHRRQSSMKLTQYLFVITVFLIAIALIRR